MPKAESRAHAVWQGTLTEGKGSVSLNSKVLSDAPVTWAARAERSIDTAMTSPEELIAAAHAACFAMAFSGALARNNTPAEQLDVTATATFETGGAGGSRIASINLDLRGRIPGIDTSQFQTLAEGAKEGCPVSKALKGNVEIRLNASLES